MGSCGGVEMNLFGKIGFTGVLVSLPMLLIGPLTMALGKCGYINQETNMVYLKYVMPFAVIWACIAISVVVLWVLVEVWND